MVELSIAGIAGRMFRSCQGGGSVPELYGQGNTQNGVTIVNLLAAPQVDNALAL
jgi:hypothetical protein